MLFYTTYLPFSEFCDPCDCGQISENFFFLNLLMQKIFFDKNHWFQLLFTENDWIISLFLSQSHYIVYLSVPISQSFHRVFFLLVKKTTFDFRLKIYCYSSPSHLTRENSVSRVALCLSFVFSFSFFGLLRPLLQICKVWLTQTPAKCTNQRA